MSYQHGIKTNKLKTQLPEARVNTSAVIVAVGTAPVHQVDNLDSIYKPILIKKGNQLFNNFGFSEDWDKYTLMEVFSAAFTEFGVSPIVVINVLDPKKHKKTGNPIIVTAAETTFLSNEDIILSSLVLTNEEGTTTYTKDVDYTAIYNEDGQVVISLMNDSIISLGTKIKLSFDEIDTSLVTDNDIIGGYDEVINRYSGLELIQHIYPNLGVIPNILIAPKFSMNEILVSIMSEKMKDINGCLNGVVYNDLPGKTKVIANQNKISKNINQTNVWTMWPLAKFDSGIYHLSTIIACVTAIVDYNNGSVSSNSPSNFGLQSLKAMVNSDGDEIFLDQIQGNFLNENGIITAINMGGWRTWGNNSASYIYSDKPMDPVDRFLSVQRMFHFISNQFIVKKMAIIDKNLSMRILETAIDDFNIYLNGLKGAGHIAGGKISISPNNNPSDLLEGKIKLRTSVGFYPPLESIENEQEYDVSYFLNEFGGAN